MFSTDSPFLHTHTRESCSYMKNCCLSTFKTLYHTLPAGRTDVVRSCYDQVLSDFLDHHTRNHRCQHLIVKFYKNFQSRSSAIYATLDLWLYTRFVGDTGCGKEREGGGVLREEKVEIVKTCIHKKE